MVLPARITVHRILDSIRGFIALETLYVLAECATVCGFLYEVAKDVVRFATKRRARKRMMQRKEADKRPPETNRAGMAVPAHKQTHRPR